MSEARKLFLEPTETQENSEDNSTLEEYFDKTLTDELVIGLCGPIGTDINFVSKCLKEIIEDDFGYNCIEIKLSDFIKMKNHIGNSARKSNDYNYYRGLIDKGNELRENHGLNILAKLAIHKITFNRQKETNANKVNGDNILFKKRSCYIINSIKHFEEYNLLKKVYNDIFYFIGVFSPEGLRLENLRQKGIEKEKLELLIETDREQKDLKSGQKVIDTFVKADYFLRIEESHESNTKSKLERFLDLIFGTDIITPTKNETAMYMASSAAGNSSCLSRQVGAAITDENGDLLSVGWNDVPKAGGGLYPAYSKEGNIIKDHRCLNVKGGVCHNDIEKDKLSEVLTDILLATNIIGKKDEQKTRELLRDSKIKDLIEFARSVHAEMHAIIIGSQKTGNRMIGGKLFCTTYPCHNCARHIIAAGIKEVYFIEPYTKSLAVTLHGDAISEKEDVDSSNTVKLLMFDGVSPNKYPQFFKMTHNNERKEKGIKKRLKRKGASPKKTLSLEAIPFLEQRATKDLISKDLQEIIDKIS